MWFCPRTSPERRLSLVATPQKSRGAEQGPRRAAEATTGPVGLCSLLKGAPNIVHGMNTAPRGRASPGGGRSPCGLGGSACTAVSLASQGGSRLRLTRLPSGPFRGARPGPQAPLLPPSGHLGLQRSRLRGEGGCGRCPDSRGEGGCSQAAPCAGWASSSLGAALRSGTGARAELGAEEAAA